jgi:5'-methylthioinosine phosphorylase
LLGIIGGSGLTEFAELQINSEVFIETPYGKPSAALVKGELHGQSLVFLARHGKPHAIPPHCVNYRANIWALKSLGVSQIIAVNAVGGISAGQESGVISFPDQIIDYTWGRQHTYSDSAEVPLQHVDFSYPYCESLRQKLLQAAQQMQLSVIDHGVYAAVQGPRLETAAEIQRLANDGCDIVGMTGMPEAGLARELSLDYACIALVVNKAAGLSEGIITMAEMQQVMHSGMQQVKTLISAYCSQSI